MTEVDGTMRGGRLLFALIYAQAVVSMALVGILSPLAVRVTTDLHAVPTAIGLTIALFSLPSAITAVVSGGIIDRVGPRRILVLAALLTAAADGVLLLARGLVAFDIGMLFAGIGFVGIVLGSPALLIGALGGAARTRAMALWPTYAPGGFALGLLMAAPFTGALDWRIAIGVHAAAMAAFGMLGVALLPELERGRDESDAAGERRPGLAQLLAVARHLPTLRLGVALSVPAIVSYGTSLVAATYIARVHGVSLAASATAVALAKIVAMMIGGTAMGALLARDVPPRRLFAIVAALGVGAQLLLYLPASPLPLAIAGLMAWLFAYAGASGIGMALLPGLTGPGRRGGAVAGVVNQLISIGSFLTPTIYFALPGWQAFVGLALAGMALSLAVLPVPARRAPALA